MKRVEYLIDPVRKLSGNTRYDANSGIGQDIMSLYLNNAQDEVTKEMVNSKTKFLQKTASVTVVNGQQEYSYPADIFMQNFDTIQWTQNGQDYINLQRGYTKYRTNVQNGYPYGYFTQNSGIVVTPPLTSGTLLYNYMKNLPKLATRSGQITSVTIASGVVTALEVSTTGTFNAAEIASDNFLCVVGYLGNIKARAIQYTGQTSGIFGIVATTLGTGETIASGDYIVIGKNASNIAELPDICEGFLIQYAYYQVKYGDASQWSKAVADNVSITLRSLVDSIGSNNDDLSQVMITNYDYLNLG